MRIVSLSPSFTEILEAIGEGSKLVAITDHCESDLEIAQIGSPKALQISAIEQLTPDLILADQNENRPEEIKALQKKFKVVLFDVRSVQAVIDAVSTIARLAENPQAAEKLITEIKTEYDINRQAAPTPPVQTLALLWNLPYLTINFDTYISRLIESSGGYNVFHQDPIREFPVDLEDLIEKNPAVLLLPKTPYPFSSRHVKRFREYRVFSKIPIHLIDGRFFSRFGPRTVEALKTFREILLEASKVPLS